MRIVRISIIALVIIATLASSSVNADMIGLSKDLQGEGNMGASFRPWLDTLHTEAANLVVTARTGIDKDSPLDADAIGFAGTVFIEKEGRGGVPRGAGVQTAGAGGSKGISGGGGDCDEELIFTYDDAVYLNSVKLWLGDIEFGQQGGASDKDDPVLFLQLAGANSFDVTITEGAILAAFSSVGDTRDKYGVVDFSGFTSLAGLDDDTTILAFKLRETSGHLYASGVAEGTAIPEPATLSLLAFGGLALMTRRLRRA